MITSDRIAIIGAHTSCLAFGLGNGMPWPRNAMKQDMMRFKQTTLLAPEGKKNLLVAGAETFKSMGSRALPGRYMATISRQYSEVGILGNNILCAPTIPLLLETIDKKIEDLHTIFFIGGENIWKEGLDFASTAYITVVYRDVPHHSDLRRLSMALSHQAVMKGFLLQDTCSITDDWDGDTRVEFLHYTKT